MIARTGAGRMDRLVAELVERFGLDLSGLAVYTEAASGPYLLAPVLTALAGARRVYAVTRDSRHAPADAVVEATLDAASRWGVANVVDVGVGRQAAWVADADVFTNSGFVRPIDAAMVHRMKPTAVVSLMWETWEFREEDLDLAACRQRGVLVLGTDEGRPPCDMRGYSALLAIKLLFELGLEGHGSRTLLLGGQPTLAVAMERGLSALGVPVTRFGGCGGRPYDALAEHFLAYGGNYDALLVAEHEDPRCLLGADGLIGFETIHRVNPALAIGVVAGAVDSAGLRQSGLRHVPAEIQPFGHMSYQPYELGPRPVLELFAAGLAVGQAMARARLAGAAPRDAARCALEVAPAMDFVGEWAWT
jgi:hypothetical protein